MERQEYYKQTGDAPTEKVVIIDESRLIEYRNGEWQGPFEADADTISGEHFEHVGKVTSDQFLQLCRAVGINS